MDKTNKLHERKENDLYTCTFVRTAVVCLVFDRTNPQSDFYRK